MYNKRVEKSYNFQPAPSINSINAPINTPSFNISFNKLLSPLFFAALFALTSLSTNPAHAQISGNVRTPTTEAGSNGQATTTSNPTFLTNKSIQLNATGSCDSTCDAMGPTAPVSQVRSVLTTRMVACEAGYTGSKTQSRNQNPDGSYTPWVDTDRSLCVCTPTFQDQTQTCAAPLGGTFIQRTNWVCSSNVGAWGTPSTITNNCFTPCALPNPSSETTSGACSSGYTGTINYERTASCPGGVGANSTSVWSAWTATTSSCVLNRPVYSAGHFPLSLYRFRMGSSWQIINSTGTTMVVTSGEFAGSWAPGTGPARWNAGGVLPLSNGQTLVVTPTGQTGNEYVVYVY